MECDLEVYRRPQKCVCLTKHIYLSLENELISFEITQKHSIVHLVVATVVLICI